MYRGCKRSHRFTILGDTSFEYDCILNREPESNVITLFMEGADKFDFFRQPDFVKDPFLKGSYAVYKKETLAGEGTGKLCHIHRPLIIDATGKKVFGDLSVKGNRLCIAIPEEWLSRAAYPVVIDPTIGTTTVGSQNEWTEEEGEDPEALYFLAAIPVNRFLVPRAVNGTCTAFAYCNEDDYDGAGRPVLYSDNAGKPWERRSAGEGLFDFGMNGYKAPGWRSAAFQSNGNIAAGSSVWFGVLAELYWYPRFDYGVTCYVDAVDDYAPVPDLYPHNSLNYYENFKLSMYFTYASAQNYTRTLTQGVKLTDTRKLTASYKRAVSMNAEGITLLGCAIDYYREHITVLSVSGTADRFRGFFRSVAEHVTTGDFITCCRDFLRTIALTILPLTAGKRNLSAKRDIATEANTQDSTAWQRGFIRTLLAGVAAADYAGKVFTLLRTVREEAAAFGEVGHVGDYLRGLYTEAGSMAETDHAGDYHRRVEDTAHNEGVSLRHLFVFIRLATLSLVRDYITGRFLKSNEELVIKSAVVREIILDSAVN
jgi:hypothetical protein